MIESEAEAQAERIRMALAEAGHPDANVQAIKQESPVVRIYPSPSLPGDSVVSNDVIWRACVVARSPVTPCLACWRDRYYVDGCDAIGLGVEDCGR